MKFPGLMEGVDIAINAANLGRTVARRILEHPNQLLSDTLASESPEMQYYTQRLLTEAIGWRTK